MGDRPGRRHPEPRQGIGSGVVERPEHPPPLRHEPGVRPASEHGDRTLGGNDDARRVREVTAVDLGSGPFNGNCDVAVDEAVHVAYISSPSGFHAIDTRTGAVLSSQGAMTLRGGQVAVDAVSHHVFVGGPHDGRGTVLAIVSSFVNRAIYPVVHRQFWVTGSGAATSPYHSPYQCLDCRNPFERFRAL